MELEAYKNIVYSIIGSAMEVHAELGPGLLEPVYNEALVYELQLRGMDVVAEQQLDVYYKGHKLDKTYRMDVVVENVICELKSVRTILPEHRLQLFNYLRLTKKSVGLLVNFGERSLHTERYVFIEEENQCYLVDKNMQIVEPLDW